ncbi:phage holin family protein [Ruminococcus difficilis]|jgi:toxin secretion/phage lysis holin|uniref:Phage holin family protein n=1 Tax=Ruminococcus difficilis TaxID=2763069 RepID=A0A934WRS1_9FIRM|nr:phage holin family protein [Ruminococcus difficilis]MBK6088731.1 phage holin family protein [Ruminococcus difficilis]
MMKENMFRALFAAAIGALAAYAGILLVPLCVLAAVMIIDYATGIAAAWSCKLLSSRVGVKGIVKKVAYLALVAVGMVVDYLISSALVHVGVDILVNYCFGMMISVWLIINELLSILENLGRLGIPLPDFLVRAVERLRDGVDRRTK